ncbi:MAG: hypothetical protein LAO31_09535 [Acidobacteriia bacterium]|nr:hypothetical protein [Terriglobia bacterium]
MKTLKKIALNVAGGAGILVATLAWGAQNQSLPIDREQMKKSIEIVESVLNKVRQQALNTVAMTVAKKGDENNPTVLYLRTSEGNPAEGIYLDGYGVIFEVYLPNFSEQRSMNWILKKSFGVTPGRRTARGPSGGAVSSQPDTSAHVLVETKSDLASKTPLDAFSKLIAAYERQSQGPNKEIALRELFSKLREINLVPQLNAFESSLLDDGSETETEKPPNEESKAEVQRKHLQDAIMKAVAEYGSSISGLQPSEYISVLLKAPVPQDFSLFSPETRTSTVIRFSVRDLRDYKAGKLSYADLEAKTKIEEN